MILLKLLHFAALICWCGSLLYLPALIVTADRHPVDLASSRLNRTVFTLLATPAALIAIASGSALFLQGGVFGVWLVAKLSLVVLLVCLHALCGALVLKVERDPGAAAALTGRCRLLGVLLCILVTAILWLVLAKPFGE